MLSLSYFNRKHHDLHVREPPEEEEETNGRPDEDLHVREPPKDEEETDDLHNEDEGVSDDNERSIATSSSNDSLFLLTYRAYSGNYICSSLCP